MKIQLNLLRGAYVGIETELYKMYVLSVAFLNLFLILFLRGDLCVL